jgi:hypothetical protein
MSTSKLGVRLIVAGLGAGALLGGTAATASAWPIQLTNEDTRYLNTVRPVFPRDDDTLLMAGRRACKVLYDGAGQQAAIDTIVAEYGATPDQANVVTNAGRGSYCTQAPS